MQPLGQRIFRRGLPVAAGAAMLGVLFGQGYRIAELLNVTVTRSDKLDWRGPLILAAIAFAAFAALECVRKEKKTDGLIPEDHVHSQPEVQ